MQRRRCNCCRRYDEARRYYDRSIALAPDQSLTYQNLAALEMSAGNLPAARRVLSSAPGLPRWDFSGFVWNA